LRRRVIDYHDHYLAPASFVRRIESSGRGKVVVLVITDANVTKHASRLNARSILMRGTVATGRGDWFSRLGFSRLKGSA
jgi:hypothetical protein